MPQRIAPGWAAACGVAAGAAGLGGGELTAAVFSASASPLLSVGSLVVDLAPPFAKTAVIAVFGTGDKPFLVVLLVVVVLALGAAGGLLQARRPPLGLAVPLLTGAVAVTAAVTRTGATAADAAPSVVAGVVGAFVLMLLVHPVREPYLARRRLIAGAVGWTAAGIVGGVIGRSLGGTARQVQTAIAGLRLPAVTDAGTPVPAAASLDVAGITPLVTSDRDFYRIDIAFSVPAIEPDDWSLEVTGEVDRPFRIGYDEVRSMAGTTKAAMLACVSNSVGGPLAGATTWQGVPVHRLLERAGVRSGADMVLTSGSDGFSASTPLGALTDRGRGALLAIGMNGGVLPQEHGFPARMIVPGLYGYVSATKWITRMEVTRFALRDAYWTVRGYSAQAPIKISSRIDVPGSGVQPGVVTVAGVAWAPTTGIGRVQLQVDGGPWRDCELAADWSTDVWRQWRYRWTAARGSHVLRVRATDLRGAVQTAAETGEVPNGATGLHTVRVAVG